MFKFSAPITGASLRAFWMCVWKCVLGACVAVVEVLVVDVLVVAAAAGREEV